MKPISARTRIAAFAVGLGLAFSGGAALGAAVGPEPEATPPAVDHGDGGRPGAQQHTADDG